MIKRNKCLRKQIALSLLVMSTCFVCPNLTYASNINVIINDNSYELPADQDVSASSVTGKLTDNKLTVENGNITGSVYGTKATSNVVVKGNVVNLTGGSVKGKIKGGYSGYVGGMFGTANATGNSIKVSGTENLFGTNISAGLYAGYAGNESLDFMTAAAQVAQSPLSILSLAGKNTSNSTAAKNITSMTAGARTEDDAYGGYAKALLTASANQNIVNIDSKDNVNGALTAVNAFVVGGYAAAGTSSEALGNTIIAENAELVSVVGSLAVVGAGSVKTSSDEKNGINSVTVKGGSLSRALGGYSRAYFSGNSESNGSIVDVRDATIAKNMIGDADFAGFFHGKIGVIGGFTQADNGNATANANVVNIENLKATAESYQGKDGFDFVIGGVAVGEGTSDKLSTVASNNKVEINNTQADLVAGGSAQGIHAQANDNIVSIKGSNTVLNNVYGGSADKGTANNNIVNWYDGSIKGSLYGGFATNSENNILNIYDSSAEKTIAKIENFQKYNFYINEYTVGEKPLLTIDNNFILSDGDELTINLSENCQLPAGLIGDSLTIVESTQGIVNNGANISLAENIDSKNSVHGLEIADNTVSLVLKEQNQAEYTINGRNVNGDAILGFKPGAELKDNKLTIDESEDSATIVNGDVYVAKANDNCNAVSNTFILKNGIVTGNIYGSFTEAGDASDNILELSGGKVTGSVYGGFSKSGNVSKNTIEINKGLFEGNIYGGFAENGAAINNIVNINNPINVNGVLYGGFSKLKNADVKTGNTLNVKAQNIALGGIANFDTLNFYIGKAVTAGTTLLKIQDKLDLKDVKVNAGIETGSKLVGGDLITLLEAKEIANFDSCITGRLNESDYAAFDFDYEQNNNQLNIKLQKLETTDNSKSLVETQMAGLSVLSQSADLRANSVFQEASAAILEDKDADFSTYAAIGGNKLKIKSGSHVDVLGWNFNLGLAKNTETKHGSLLLAPIFEYGHGNYDSYLDNGYHGKGSSHYWGAGVMAKKSQNSGLYYEGSICGGKLKSDYKAKDNSYETESPYISVHAGIGKLIKVNTKDSFDFYSKYFYIHESGDTTTVNTSSVNHELKLEEINSNRSRLGMQFKHAINTNSHYYAGLAWMHEFSGKARAALDGTGIAAPSIKGDSGILELGWRLQPIKGRYDLALDMAGYTGKQKGASVNLKFSWNF